MDTSGRISCFDVIVLLSAAALAVGVGSAPARAQVGIQGTMSNFDVFNETGVNVYGAEIELEGCHSTDVMKTYPAHFDNLNQTEYSTGTTFGTRLIFTGYNFDPSGYIIPRVGQNTNGHYAVNLPGCEHFGFSIVGTQPTVTRFFWLDSNFQRIGTKPMSIPSPTWNYVPAAPGVAPVIHAVVQAPPPEVPEPQLPDSIWMKVYVTELERPVDLGELISGPDSVAPHHETEIETEWVLLEGGVPDEVDVSIGPNTLSILRRYEYFKYTGPYDPEDHAPLSTWSGVGEPPVGELGGFIAANMVAANLAAPVCRYNLAGDLNADCMVDLNDLAAFAPFWLLTGCGAPDWCSGTDATQDSTVKIDDLAVMAADWMLDCTLLPGNPACKPI